MLLDIVTPERRVRSLKNADVRLPVETDDVILPGIEGEFEVMPGHSPFITLLGTGILSFKANGQMQRLMVSGGFAEIDRDRVTVMCEAAALPEEVTADTEAQSLVELEKRLQELGSVSLYHEKHRLLRAEAERAASKLRLVK